MKFIDYSKNGQIVSFDFDDTLLFHFSKYNKIKKNIPHLSMVKKLREHSRDGDTVYIISNRRETAGNRTQIELFVEKLKLDVREIFFTNNERKSFLLKELKCNLHYDDDENEMLGLPENTIGISSVDDELMRRYNAYNYSQTKTIMYEGVQFSIFDHNQSKLIVIE